MAQTQHRSRRSWAQRLAEMLLPIIPAIPAMISTLSAFGAIMTDEVWALHALIGTGLLLSAGILSLGTSARLPSYRWHALLFFGAAFLTWYFWQNPSTEYLAYTISTAVSVIATWIIYTIMRTE